MQLLDPGKNGGGVAVEAAQGPKLAALTYLPVNSIGFPSARVYSIHLCVKQVL